MERIGAFSADKLETKYGFVRFEQGNGRYGFDLGAEKWYQKTTILDAFYKPFGKDYIAPWKLIPTGDRDVVEAYHDGSKDIDLSRVRFASAPDSPALPADYDEARRAWTLTLPAAESNRTYEVFDLYEGKVIGKLRVVSYPKQRYKLRLVPVNGQSLGDVSRLSQQLNSIYNKHGVSFTLSEAEGVSTELKAKSESVLVQFKVKRGTIRSLEGIGITGRNHSRILAQHPLLKEDRSPWALENARFKLENGQVNIALD